MKLLLVEDDANIREMISNCLSDNYELEMSQTYYCLIPKDKTTTYILDHDNDYGMSGSEWIARYGLLIPVSKRILISAGDGWIKNAVEGRKLNKPFRIEELINCVEASRDTERVLR